MNHNVIIFAILLLCVACNPKTESTAKLAEVVDVVKENMESEKLLRHVVLFKFKEDADPAAVKNIEEAFSALPDKIDAIHSYEWGVNNSPEGLNKGLTHCFFVTFKSEEDREVYLPHPDHKAFVELLGPVLDDVTVVDYWNQ